MSKLFLAMISTVVIFLAGHTACFATNVALRWNASTDPSVTGYKVYYQADSPTRPFSGKGATQGASPINVSNVTSATISGLDPNHAYYFAVTAYNSSGVESSYSNIASIPETAPPTVSLTVPASNSSVSGTVSVTASATDNIGVTKVEFYVNNVLQATDTASPYSFSWNTTTVANGSYPLTAKAYDAAGNVGQSSAAVTVNNTVSDSTSPTVAISSPASSATMNGTVTVSATASDNVGVTKMTLYIDNVLKTTVSSSTLAWAWDTNSYTKGSHVITVQAFDAANNVGTTSITVNK